MKTPSPRPQALTRRAFLRGAAGISLTVPWLESLPLRAAQTGEVVTKAAAAVKPPVRFASLYFSNGVEPIHWWAKGSGAQMEIGPGLEPMMPFREDFNFLRGLYNQQAVAHKSPHLGRISNLLSGGWVSTDQNDIRCGQTMDQLMAQQIGDRTPIPSLVLGIEPTEMRLEDGLSMLYGSCISWGSETKPAMKEIYPARVFDLLVGDPQGRARDRSILDEVMSDAKDLQRKIAAGDRQKLTDYLDSIRDVEKRIDHASKDGRLEGSRPVAAALDMKRPAEQLPQNIPEHMKLMLDLIVLAFRMDKTRIATCMLNNDLSQMNFGFIEGVQGSLHLDLTHNGRDPKREAMYLKTNQFHLQQFAYLLGRLKAIDEGGQSLLDNSMILCCSNLFDGDRHQADQMPMLLAGRAGGTMKTGRVLDYLERGNENRRACSLYLSLMDRMGVNVTRFGDADNRLADI
jgi:hypothetical protein